jgi:hypothetical protein
VAIETVFALPLLTGQQRRSGYRHCPNFLCITTQKEIEDYRNIKKNENEEKLFLFSPKLRKKMKDSKRKSK